MPRAIVDHLAHIVNTVGEDHAALGSDWDGAIITPRDMPTCLELPRLVQLMLDRGMSSQAHPEDLGRQLPARVAGAARVTAVQQMARERALRPLPGVPEADLVLAFDSIPVLDMAVESWAAKSKR